MPGAPEAGDNEEHQEQQHHIWKKNAPFLYDILMTKELAWPTLTVEWLPERRYDADKECNVHRLLLGTNTNGEEPNHLIITEVFLPPQPTTLNMKLFDMATEEVGGYAQTNARIAIKSETGPDGKNTDKAKIMLVHEQEVLAAHCCPQNPNVIATKPGKTSDVLMFDIRQQFWVPKPNEGCMPNLRLKNGRDDGEGYALAWSPHKEGLLASSGADAIIDIWDLSVGNQQHTPQLLKGHTAMVEDIAFHFHNSNILGTASDDNTAALWDMRHGPEGPALQFIGHHDEVNSISFGPWNPLVVATGSSDQTVALWDLRKPTAPLHLLTFHTTPIYKVRFAPFHETILASSALDGRVLLWDLSKAGQPASDEGLPAELLFIHSGHNAPISDISWNCSVGDEWLMASASENNLLHVWRMADEIYERW